jgi:hypothetical protein
MPDSYYESRKRWNAANYRQFNVAIRPELSEGFRAACERNQMSMRAVLTEFMAAYAETPTPEKSPKNRGYNERSQRRKAVGQIISQLEAIRDAEEQYKENIPEGLGTVRKRGAGCRDIGRGNRTA